MSSSSSSKILRVAIIAVAVCGIIACVFIIPTIGSDIIETHPELSHWYLPWLIFMSISTFPYFLVLVLAWITSGAIKKDLVFTHKTARFVKLGSIVLFCGVGFFLFGNIMFFFLSMSHPAILLVSLFVGIFGVALAVCVAILARYLTKAATLQEEVDGTV